MTIHRMFLVDLECPLRNIVELDCPIFVGPKMSWAVLPDGSRRLLGSSAFYTRPAAVRTKLAKLQRIKNTTALARMQNTSKMYEAACWQLQIYEKTGEIR